MPSTSKAQQRLFGMIHAYQTGKLKHPSGKVKQVAKHISKTDATHFAETKQTGLPEHVKKAFDRGFFNRATELQFSIKQAEELYKSANFSDSLTNALHSLYPQTHDSLINVADRTDAVGENPQVEYFKHMARHGIAPGAVGAGIGAISGLTAKKDENKLDRAGKGALLGGALGFGSGALYDAYHMGDNTRSQLIDDYQTQKENKHWGNTDKLDKNIDALKKSNWYDFYSPERVHRKLS